MGCNYRDLASETSTNMHAHTHREGYKAQSSARGHPQIPHFITRPAIPDWSKSMLDNSTTLIPSSLHPCLPLSIPPPHPLPFVPLRLASLPPSISPVCLHRYSYQGPIRQ